MTFSEKVIDTIKKYDMLKYDKNVTVGLSGGADSVSLLLVLCEIREILKIGSISAAHINHMIRGADADRDMRFVGELCDKTGVKLYTLKKDVTQYARINKCSLEDAGRRVRYEFFSEVTEKENSCLATAHTKNDNSENFFISALRGTRISGIPPIRDNIIRPLINVTKDEIYEYLKEKNQDFCVDETNFSDDYFRNKIRLKLIPYINENFSVDIADTLESSLDVMYREDSFLKKLAKDFIKMSCVFKNGSISVKTDEFNKLDIALKRRVIRMLYYAVCLRGYISHIHADSVIKLSNDGKTGKRITLNADVIAEISYGNLVLRKNIKKSDFCIRLNVNESICINENMNLTLSDTRKSGNKAHYFLTDDSTFTVRRRKNGDKLFIKGVGHKKLSDFLTDRKIPEYLRDFLPVTEDSKGICSVGNIYFRKADGKNTVYVNLI